MPKTQTFEEYFKNWKKKQPMKLMPDGTPMDDSGATSGVIRGSAPHPLDLKGKKRERVHTRIKKAGDPRVGVINTRNAAKRRKKVLLEV